MHVCLAGYDVQNNVGCLCVSRSKKELRGGFGVCASEQGKPDAHVYTPTPPAPELTPARLG